MRHQRSDQLDLHWSESSDSSPHSTPTSLSPTQYADYSKTRKSKESQHCRRSLKVEFARCPLIEIREFVDDEDRNDALESLHLRHDQWLKREKKLFSNLNASAKKLNEFKITKELYAVYTNNLMKMGWYLCHSRRCYQQSVQYMLRFLGMTTPKAFSLRNIDLLICVCLRLAAKHNNGRYEATGDDKVCGDID